MSRRNFVLGALVGLLTRGAASATPPLAHDRQPSPLDAALVFSRLPDAEGRAEIELSLEANQALVEVSVRAEAFGPARLEATEPGAPDRLEAGASFAWRTRVRFRPDAQGIPPGLRVEIRARPAGGGEDLVLLKVLPLVPARPR